MQQEEIFYTKKQLATADESIFQQSAPFWILIMWYIYTIKHGYLKNSNMEPSKNSFFVPPSIFWAKATMKKGLPLLLLILKCYAIESSPSSSFCLDNQFISSNARPPPVFKHKNIIFQKKKKETRSFLFSLYEDYIFFTIKT